jgi:DNA-binding MarR family transcriptional regulator
MESPHRNPSTGYLVWRLSMKWRAQIDRILAPLELTHAQYSLLASLYSLSRGGARPSQRELADFSGLEAIYVSKLIRALERDGQVRRSVSSADSRAVALELTDQGRERIEAAIAIVGAFLEEALAPMGGSDSEQSRAFTRLLETLLE